MDKRLIGKTCPYCKTPFQEGDVVVICSTCEMPHHLACWTENQGCTTFGCTGSIIETIGGTASPNAATSYAAPTPQPARTERTDNTHTIQPPVSNQPVRPVVARVERPVEKPEQPESRFETLFDAEPCSIQDNIPVMLEKVSLIIDHQKEALFVRSIFRSLTDTPILAMLTDVRCKDVWGKETTPVEGYQYLDLKTKRDSTFGQTAAIPIPDRSTRTVDVVIKKILYADRTMVDATGSSSILEQQKTLDQFFGNEELKNEYIRETNTQAKYTTVSGKQYWRCACGSINRNGEQVCYRCKANKESLISRLNVELIAANLAAFKEEKRLKAEREKAEREERIRQAEEQMRKVREEQERIAREEAERIAEEKRQKKARRRKIAKRTTLIITSALVLAFLVYATIWHIIPYIRYTKASQLLEEKSFDEAYAEFVSLGNWSDSENRAIDTLFQKGSYLLKEGSYIEAAAAFERVPTYKDSSEKAVYCRNEAAYLDAKALFDKKDYKGAIDAFSALTEYSDSADWALESTYCYAQMLLENEEFEEAHSVYLTIPDYKESKTQANECYYRYATKLFNERKYEDAYTYFTKVSSFKDSKDQANESYYLLGNQLYTKKKYDEAYKVFQRITSYKDSKDLANEAEYLYAIECFDAGKYEQAVSAFKNVSSYKDVKDRLPEAKYQYALQLTSKSRWKDASTLFKELDKYKDSQKQYKETYYQYGLQLLREKSYTGAVTVFEALGNYQESKTKLNEARYAYVKAHKNSTDTTTYKYLTELKKARYLDSSDIYDKLYAWSATVVINDSDTNATKKQTSISKYKKIYCHISLFGGPPNGEVVLRAVAAWPDGSTSTVNWKGEKWRKGESGSAYYWYTTPSAGRTGTFTLKVYADNVLIGQSTINITN